MELRKKNIKQESTSSFPGILIEDVYVGSPDCEAITQIMESSQVLTVQKGGKEVEGNDLQ